MKITFNRKNLLEAIDFVASIVPSHAVVEAVKTVKIIPEENRVIFMTTNLDQMTEAVIEAEIVDAMEPFLVNAEMLHKIVKILDGQEVILNYTQNVCNVQSNGSTYKLMTMTTDDFPEFINFTEKYTATINSNELIAGINGTIFCVNDSSVQEMYKGVNFSFETDKVTLVSLDGFRVAVRNLPCEANRFQCIIPGKTLEIIPKNFTEETIVVSADDKFVSFSNNKFKVISKLLNGTFLDYKTAVPTEINATVNMDTQKLLNLLNKASLVTGEKVRQPIVLTVGNDEIEASVTSTIGAFEEYAPAETQGNLEKIGLNTKFFLQAIKAIKDENVQLKFMSPLKPCLITPVDDSDKYLYLILPIRVRNAA